MTEQDHDLILRDPLLIEREGTGGEDGFKRRLPILAGQAPEPRTKTCLLDTQFLDAERLLRLRKAELDRRRILRKQRE